MHYQIPAADEALRTQAAAFAKTILAPQVLRMEATGGFPWNWYDACAKECFLSTMMQEGKINHLRAVLVFEEISRVSPSLGIILCTQMQSCYILQQAPHNAYAKEVLEKVIKGEALLAYALSEENSGSDISSICVTAMEQS